MALKQLIKTQMKWRKKTQKWVEIETATKIRINVIEKKKRQELWLSSRSIRERTGFDTGTPGSRKRIVVYLLPCDWLVLSSDRFRPIT